MAAGALLALRSVEKALTELKLGVDVSYVMHETEDGLRRTVLHFMKWGGAWKLMREVSCDDEPSFNDMTPLLNASREARIEAVRILPALVATASDSVEREIKRIQDSSEKARAFVQTLAELKS